MPTKLFTTILLLSGFALGTFTSCSDKKEKETSFDLAAAKKAVDEGNQFLMDCLKKGDSSGFASMYASGAKIMPPNESVVSGKENITSMIGAWIRMGIKNFNLKALDVWGSESLVGEEGQWNVTDDAGKELDHGKYIVLWKMEDGKWKLFRDIWNSDNPCPAPAK